MSKDKEPDFRRPNHPDFMNSSELKKMEFTGVRANKLTQQLELWTFGDLRLAMSMQEASLYPDKWAKKYAEIFGLDEAVVEGTGIPGQAHKSSIILQ